MSDSNRKKVATVCFTISGAFMTKHHRSLVLERRWNFALEALVQSLHGFTYDYAISILKGDKKLIGDTKYDEGLDLADEDPKVKAEYEERLDFLYKGVLRRDTDYFRPYAVVTNFGPEDMRFTSPRLMGDLREMSELEWIEQRGRHYTRNRDSDLIFSLNTANADINSVGRHVVLFEHVEMPPFWINPTTIPQKAFEQFLGSGKHLDITGHQECYPDYAKSQQSKIAEEVFVGKDEKVKELAKQKVIDVWTEQDEKQKEIDAEAEKAFQQTCARVKEQIEEILGDDPANWYDLKVGEKTWKIPKPPFDRWCLRGTSGWHLEPEWENLAPSGMKMYSDSRDHSDVVLGAGVPEDQWYSGISVDGSFEDMLWDLRSKVLEEILGFECVVVSGSGYISGDVKHPKPDEAVSEGDIIVIPVGSVEYSIPVLSVGKTGMVIMERGSNVCHVAKIGREGCVKIIQARHAMRLYQKGTTIHANLDKGTIKIAEY